MAQFLKTLLTLSLAGTGLALTLMLLERILGKHISSRLVYGLWLLVLLRLILPVPGLLSVPVAAPPTPTPVETPAPKHWDGQYIRHYEANSNPAPGGVPGQETQTFSGNREPVGSETPAPAPVSREAERTALPTWTLLFWLWAAGTVCAVGWNLWAYFRYRRALSRTLRRAREQDALCLNALHPRPGPALYRSDAVTTPLLLGLLRPVIVLPDRAYTPEMLDGILRHELTHYRRGDLAVKWFAAAVFCVHWFNPLVYLFRRELERACELSCDARLLRDMDTEEKQRYGELLLALAANRPFPHRVVAMSFATEKRDLKERLIQIMTFKKKGWACLTLMLLVLALLVGCAVALGPADDRETPPPAPVENDDGAQGASPVVTPPPIRAEASDMPVIVVDSVDAFLEALGSDRVLVLRPGEYDLTQASDYGGDDTERYYWAEVNDGYELVIRHMENLTIQGAGGAEPVSFVTQPRYANVLSFYGCSGLSLDSLIVGHTQEQGVCMGSVLYFGSCIDVSVDGCVLYGCGTVGINATGCSQVSATRTTIKECSYGALWASSCYDVRFTDGKIYDCGQKNSFCDLLQSRENTGFVVFNTEIYNNDAHQLLSSIRSVGVELRGCRIYGNRPREILYSVGHPVLFDGCALNDNAVTSGHWYAEPAQPAVDGTGAALSAEALQAMEWAPYTDAYDGPAAPELPEPPYELDAERRMVFHVTTVDEFLGAIGSDRVIYLDGELFDLSAATIYGGYGGKHYYWRDAHDGPGLVISGVENLSIIGQGQGKTRVETQPRYADVLAFLDCHAVTVRDLTAGHTQGAGACSGDVISFRNCNDCVIENCGLFGCGVNGINAYDCWNLTVRDTEIYECSGYGAVIQQCYNTVFEGGSIHDCAYNTIWADSESTVIRR